MAWQAAVAQALLSIYGGDQLAQGADKDADALLDQISILDQAKNKNKNLEETIKTPLWYIHNGKIPNSDFQISYGIILNLASVCNATNPDVLWGFLKKYLKEDNNIDKSYLNILVTKALKYYQDFIHPNKKYRIPNKKEIIALKELEGRISKIKDFSDQQEIQNQVYETGKNNDYQELKDWFSCLYEILLGQKEGPRMGSFISIYGAKETIELIHNAVEGKLVKTK